MAHVCGTAEAGPFRQARDAVEKLGEGKGSALLARHLSLATGHCILGHPSEQFAGRMVLGIAHDANNPSQGLHYFPLGDSLLGVIRSFAMYIGTELSQNTFGVWFIKDHHEVDALQSCDEFAARFGAENRPSRTLESRDRAVAVDPNHQNVAMLSGSLQVTHMPNMQQVEATVGKGNASPFATQSFAQGC
jgi:hypothetical protein